VAGAPPGPPPTAQAQAPIDLTGYWFSVVTEDWRWRMLTPAKGDYASVPLNAEGQRIAGMWDLEKDKADGNLCRAFGAAGFAASAAAHSHHLAGCEYPEARNRFRPADTSVPVHSFGRSRGRTDLEGPFHPRVGSSSRSSKAWVLEDAALACRWQLR
jgi:hypothetical protein